jgi:hypothetical protein
MNNLSPAGTAHGPLQRTAAIGLDTLPNMSTNLPTGFIRLSTTSL